MPGDEELSQLDNDVLKDLEKLPGKYWMLGRDQSTGEAVFRQEKGPEPAHRELFIYKDVHEMRGWVFATHISTFLMDMISEVCAL